MRPEAQARTVNAERSMKERKQGEAITRRRPCLSRITVAEGKTPVKKVE